MSAEVATHSHLKMFYKEHPRIWGQSLIFLILFSSSGSMQDQEAGQIWKIHCNEHFIEHSWQATPCLRNEIKKVLELGPYIFYTQPCICLSIIMVPLNLRTLICSCPISSVLPGLVPSCPSSTVIIQHPLSLCAYLYPALFPGWVRDQMRHVSSAEDSVSSHAGQGDPPHRRLWEG